MAVIKPTDIKTLHTNAVAQQWAGMKQGDVGLPVAFAPYSSKTVHVHGDFGTGATVTLRGSNVQAPNPEKPEDWFALTDDQSNQIVKSKAGGCNVSESPIWVSPAVAEGADDSAAINVSISGRN